MKSRRWFSARILAAGGAGLVATRAGSADADTVTYTYDELGRLFRATYSNGTTITYCYDAAGNRTQIRQETTPASCGSSPPPPPPPPPPTGTFTATPSAINQGSSSTLSWTSTDATVATIDNGIGTVATNGAIGVTPSATTTYTLTLTGPGGSIQKQAAVNVTPAGFFATIPVTGASDLRALANAAGYNGTSNATITFVVASGTTITGSAGAPAGGTAITTGSWPTSGYTIALTLDVSGSIYGGGGKGGNGGSVSGAGGAGGGAGDAISCQGPLTIIVNASGQIKGGGGGGGGGGSKRLVSGGEPHFYGGGGGGGGFPNGVPGAGGTGDTANGSAGSSGTTSGGGAGGLGGGGAPAGGAGGGAAASGTAGGASFSAGGGAGVPGYAVKKNGNTVTVTNNGTITGTVA